MDDEWEEEEQLVVVELSGIINNDFLSKCQTCKMLDIDSERPMMQVGQYVFAGEYDDALGTCVLFEELPKKGKAKDSPGLRYMCHTVRKLTMQRIFLTEKREEGQGDKQQDTTCLSNQSKTDGTHGTIEESTNNTNLEDPAVG